MVKAEELRIGNWLQLGKRYQRVFRITYDRRLEHCVNYEDVPVTEYEPIPLTISLLEKIGFKRTVFEDMDALRLDLYVSVGRSLSLVYFPKSEAEGCLLFNNATPVGEMEYIYLHQVQNVYFAMTGRELPIQL